VIPEARWLTHEAVCKARRAADGRADGLIQPAGFAGNSGKNSGFRQTGRVRRSFSRQNYCKFKVLTENRRCRRNSGEIRRNSGFRAWRAESPSHEAPFGPFILRPRKRIAQSYRITPVETCESDQIGQTPRLLVLSQQSQALPISGPMFLEGENVAFGYRRSRFIDERLRPSHIVILDEDDLCDPIVD